MSNHLISTLPREKIIKLQEIKRNYQKQHPDWYDSCGYMTRKHPDAFKDMPVKKPKHYTQSYTKLCPICQGHGGWNLRLDAYGTNEHFKGFCTHCLGWGYVNPEETCQEHFWVFKKNLSRCYNRYECFECGKIWDIDSSD